MSLYQLASRLAEADGVQGYVSLPLRRRNAVSGTKSCGKERHGCRRVEYPAGRVGGRLFCARRRRAEGGPEVRASKTPAISKPAPTSRPASTTCWRKMLERICEAFENHFEKRGDYHEGSSSRLNLRLEGIRPAFIPAYGADDVRASSRASAMLCVTLDESQIPPRPNPGPVGIGFRGRAPGCRAACLVRRFCERGPRPEQHWPPREVVTNPLSVPPRSPLFARKASPQMLCLRCF